MIIGFIGLGKMGSNIVLNLLNNNHKVIIYNRSSEKTKEIAKKGAIPAFSIKEFIEKLPKRKIIWLMLPHGKPVNEIITKLFPYLSPNDIIIDGGNSYYKSSIKWAKKLENYKINFIDVGVSGGPSGARNGACLMIGGRKNTFEELESLYKSLSVPNGYEFFEGYGAGHFIKMIHNGIEYGMMQSIAEGFAILKKSHYNLSLKKIAKLYSHGSVIESKLILYLKSAFEKYKNELKEVSGKAESSGEGEWTVKTAKELNISAKVIEDSVKARKLTQKKPDYKGKIITALRSEFGGHKIN